MTVFQLACLNQGELSAAIISQFYKDFQFTINNTTYIVHNISKLNKKKDNIITHKQRIIIKSNNSNKNIVGYLIYLSNKKSLYYGNNQWNDMSRNIESIINLDIINIFNPFHQKSILYKLIENKL